MWWGFSYALLCVAVQFQGPIYTHSENPAPLPPQGMIVQPEMHLPHPGEEHRAAGPALHSLCPFLWHGGDLLPSCIRVEFVSIFREEK